METIMKLDQYKEHELHDTYNKLCSECYKKSRILHAKVLVNTEDKGSRLELSKKLGLVPKDSTLSSRLCWNTNGLCDDERCYC